jgi:DNA replication protein DnaC
MNTENKRSRKLRNWERFPAERRMSMFPPRIRQLLPTLTFTQDISSLKQTSTYIWGEAGTGKTMLASAILYAQLKENFVSETPATSAFITAVDLLQELRSTYKQADNNITEDQILKYYKTVDWLLLDDIGTEKTTDWAFSMLYQIINFRYENLKRTIFTSNCSVEDLRVSMKDDRIPRRIEAMCTKIIHL